MVMFQRPANGFEAPAAGAGISKVAARVKSEQRFLMAAV
jgi:hypothetical protein